MDLVANIMGLIGLAVSVAIFWSAEKADRKAVRSRKSPRKEM